MELEWYCNSVVWGQMIAILVSISTMYRLAQSLCCVPETNVTLYLNYTLKSMSEVRREP